MSQCRVSMLRNLACRHRSSVQQQQHTAGAKYPSSSCLVFSRATPSTCSLTVPSFEQLQQRGFASKPPSDKESATATAPPPKKDPNAKSPPKTNFAKKFLEPAARGDLPRSTPIPKLAVRKPKSSNVHDDTPGPIEASLNDLDKEKQAASSSPSPARRARPTPSIPSNTVTGGIKGIIHRASRRRRRYERGEEGDPAEEGEGGAGKNSAQRTSRVNRLKQIVARLQPETFATLNPALASENNRTFLGPKSPDAARSFQSQKRGKGRGRGRDDGKQYDLFGDEIPPEELADPMISPLVSFRYDNVAPESARKAGVQADGGRKRPPKAFMERFEVYGYLTNVECPVVHAHQTEGDTTTDRNRKTWGRYRNPLERHTVSDTVSKLMDVPVENVFPASMTSAFVGFPKKDAADAPLNSDTKTAAETYLNSERKRLWRNQPLTINLYDPNASADDDDHAGPLPLSAPAQQFIESSANDAYTLLHLGNIPSGLPAHTIASALNPVLPLQDYVEDLHFIDPYNAVLRISTDILPSTNISTLLSSSGKNNTLTPLLATLGRQYVRMQPAKRPIVHDTPRVGGFYPVQKLSTSRGIVVDGDSPTDKFYRDHADVLLLTDVPSHITSKDISRLVQPYSWEVRDVHGSIEAVVDLDGKPTGRYYVGFDTIQECQAAWDGLSTMTNDNGVHFIQKNDSPAPTHPIRSPTRIRRVREQPLLAGNQKFGPRTYRSAEELHYELHSKWREYVTPENWKKISDAGIHETVLADAFYAARIHNPTYSYEDDARVGEKLLETHQPGQHFEEFVKDYVEAVIENVSTVEDPGAMYEGMFFPGEEMDTELIEREQERVKTLAGEEYYG